MLESGSQKCLSLFHSFMPPRSRPTDPESGETLTSESAESQDQRVGPDRKLTFGALADESCVMEFFRGLPVPLRSGVCHHLDTSLRHRHFSWIPLDFHRCRGACITISGTKVLR